MMSSLPHPSLHDGCIYSFMFIIIICTRLGIVSHAWLFCVHVECCATIIIIADVN